MEEKINKKSFVASISWIIRFIWRVNKGYSLSLFILNIFQGIIPPIMLWIGKLILDSVVQGIGVGQEAFIKTVYYLIILLGINVFNNIIISASSGIQTILGDIVINEINSRVMTKSISLDMFYYEEPKFYDMLSRAQIEASYKPIIILSHYFDLLRNTIMLASLIIVLIRLNWIVVIILVLISIPYSLSQQKYAEKGYSLLYNQTQDQRKMLYYFRILTSSEFVKEIKLFNLGKYFIDRYCELYKKMFVENKRLIKRKYHNSFLWSLLSVGNYIGVYTYIIYRTILKNISLGDMTLYSGAFLQCQMRFNAIVNNITLLYENSLFINNIFMFLKLEPIIVNPNKSKNHDSNIKEGIIFDNVSFRYPGTDRYILKNISFKIKPQESIGLVGDNGAGKTTIVKLICRFYDPDSGVILLDGEDIRNIDLEKYQDLIGVVFQDYSQFCLTSRENIGLGCIKNIENMNKIKNAAKKSGADKVIERLAHGYESVLGRYFDNGIQISIGEWQKIAIARAFMSDAKILILDEPTSSMDTKTEHEIYRKFEELTRGRISILISHRFSTLRMVDKIFVLQDGMIVERGSHQELMNINGKYAEMFTIQAEKYSS